MGPSALDWVLLGDDGTIDDANELLKRLDTAEMSPGRTHWGLTVLQAIEEFDAGPIWAFEQFPIDIDQPELTKSELYRGPITQSAITATLAAIGRIQQATASNQTNGYTSGRIISPHLKADPSYQRLSVSDKTPFQGGRLHHRPLLKAAQREFDVSRHTSEQISRRIRCGDSQPGALSKCFGSNLYVYGGIIEFNPEARHSASLDNIPCRILGMRNQAVCISTCDGKGIWITHVRRPKTKNDAALWPKVPATSGLLELGLLTASDIQSHNWPPPADWSLSPTETFQEVWIDWEYEDDETLTNKTAYVYFDFYNGAMATEQCSHLISALDYILTQHTLSSPIQSIVLMGGSYFSNGVALNVIEASADPALESWHNINRIDDIVHYLLQEFPSRGIITIAAMRGNAAAGGVALAAACDIVIAGSTVVLNPSYRAIGLFGSEYHTLSYYGRCGTKNATKILRDMLPISSLQAQAIGLVDYVFPGTGEVLYDYVRTHVSYLMSPGILKTGLWKRNVDLSPAALAMARTRELGEMSLDFWSPRAVRYHEKRFLFVRKVKALKTPLRFAEHRRRVPPQGQARAATKTKTMLMFGGMEELQQQPRLLLDEEETEEFDSVEYWRKIAEDQLVDGLRRKLIEEVQEQQVRRVSSPTPTTTTTGDTTTDQPEKMPPLQRRQSFWPQDVIVHSVPELPMAHHHQQKCMSPSKNLETVFSCYYKAPGLLQDLMLPTPPESPMELGAAVGRGRVGSLGCAL